MTAPLAPDFRPRFHELHRVGRRGWWRSVVGAIVALALVFIVVPVVLGLVAFVVLMATGMSPQEAQSTLDLTAGVTPAGLAVLNIVLAAAIPTVWLVSWLFHRLKPRWLSSVRPRLRWRYLLLCVPLSIVALVAALAVGLLLPAATGDPTTTQVNDFTRQTRDLLLVVLLLTPLQAAGEEYLFRGYLTQAFGSVLRARRAAQVLAVLGPAVIFALVHGLSQDLPVFFDRFAFGVVAGILVLRTGGLEAGIAMHVLNNFFAFGLALAFGDITQSLTDPQGGSWWSIASTLTQSLVYLGLASWVARLMRLETSGPPVGGPSPLARPGGPELVAPPPRV